MNQRQCVALCTGNEAAPTCAEGFVCPVVSDGVLNICLPECDPLAQDCAVDMLCLPSHDFFLCALDASGSEGQVFDPCEFANACDTGLLCVNPSAASECDPNVDGCCMPFCDLDDANFVCPGDGQACLSLHDEGQAPPKYVNVGVCFLPE